jgi:Domain of unknown function (DUF4412)
MKHLLVTGLIALVTSTMRADLTVVQKIEGGSTPGLPRFNQVTIKIKGDKTRIETGPQATMIIDRRSGETITLMHEQKQILRIPGDKAKAMVEMATKFQGGGTPEVPQKLVATGKKETIEGMETEIYTSEFREGKATYWIATHYSNAQEILRQLQAMQPSQWTIPHNGMPDYHALPGVPIKTLVDLGGTQITSTVVAIKQEPLADSEFSVPADYSEMKIPRILGGEKTAPSREPAGAAEVPSPAP